MEKFQTFLIRASEERVDLRDGLDENVINIKCSVCHCLWGIENNKDHQALPCLESEAMILPKIIPKHGVHHRHKFFSNAFLNNKMCFQSKILPN
jgi:hypothetical protein